MNMDIDQIVSDLRQKIASRAVSDADDFSESDYLELYPDVAQAIAAGTYRSGYEHWLRVGMAEGRRGRKHLDKNNPWRAGGNGAPAGSPMSRPLDAPHSRTLSPHLLDGIGEPTPLVNTFRGRLAHTLMRWMGKALWWYSHSIKRALEPQARAVAAMQDDLRDLALRQEHIRKEFLSHVQALESELSGLPARAAALERRLAEAAKTATDNGTIHIPNLANRIAALDLYANQNRAALSLQERRVSLLLEQMRKTTHESPPTQEVSDVTDPGAALYLDFEAAFRGTREEIRERQRIYIPILHEAGAGQHDRPILDLGCGRGEWLDLLRAANLEASGADTNERMIDSCRALGLNVVLRDALSYLRSVPDNSLGAVTAFHLVEHLPFDTLLALIDESIRVLMRGGLLILETPNPGNVLVGAQYFYLDPTHVRPLPSPMLRFFVETRGMCRVEVKELNPYPESMWVPGDGSELAKRFNQYFYGPRDYAVIGRRP